jgi:hypothetical protein
MSNHHILPESHHHFCLAQTFDLGSAPAIQVAYKMKDGVQRSLSSFLDSFARPDHTSQGFACQLLRPHHLQAHIKDEGILELPLYEHGHRTSSY